MKKILVITLTLFVFASGNSFGQEPIGFQDRLAVVKKLVDDTAALKEQNNPEWQSKVYEAYGEAGLLYKQNPSSPEVILLLARCYWYNDRPAKARKAIAKALYFNPSYIDAVLLKGDIYADEAIIGGIARGKGAKRATKVRKARKAYETALKVSGIDKDTESLIYLKLGSLYDDTSSNKKKAKKFWEKAVSKAPDSSAAEKARQRLNALK